MKSHGSLFSPLLQSPLQPPSPTPRPLQLLAECSLAIASQSHLPSVPARSRHIFDPVHPSSADRSRGKRKASHIMTAHQPDDDFQLREHHDQQHQQHQQGRPSTFGNLLFQPSPSPSSPRPGLGKNASLNTLICAAQSSPCPVQDTPPAPSSADPRTILALKPPSVCSSAASCCDVDDCTSKCASECDDEDCTEPCEDCLDTPCDLNTTCQIVPILCSEKTCLGPKAPCPEDETCVQEIICQKDGCEVTSCYPSLDYSGYGLSGHTQSFVEPASSWGTLQTFHESVEPGFLDLNYGSSVQQQLQLDQLQQLSYPQQQLFTFPNQQQLNNHIQVIATSEPSQSSRSSSTFLESYDSFSSNSHFDHDYSASNKRRRVSSATPLTSPSYEHYNATPSFSSNSPFDHDYSASTKRRRVSSATPLTSPSYEHYNATPSKSSTPFSEPLPQWPNYNSPNTVQPSWNGNDLLGSNNLLGNNNCLSENNLFVVSDTNLLELGDCHWNGCNAHLATDEDLQLHLSTHLDPSLEQCLWDACGLEVHGLDELKSHLRHEHLVPAEVESTTSASEGPRKCEWEDLSGDFVKDDRNVKDGGGVVCGKVLSSTEELQKHVKEVHIAVLKKKTGYYCCWKSCGRRDRGFSQKGKVERHMQTHTGFKSCKCHFCDKEFSATQALQQHIRTHTGEKPYKCDFCQKEFAQGSALTMHKRVHTGDRPLKCKFPGCGKRFSESSNLSKHRKTHLSVGQHRCGYPGCDRTFHRLDQMKRHQKVHGIVVSASNNPFLEQPCAPLDDFALQQT